jgi:ubiquinol-cytochrome c reductase iron-sulfur subunit
MERKMSFLFAGLDPLKRRDCGRKTHSRRDFLKIAAAALGAFGAAAAAYPFIRALSPTKDIIEAGLVKADISDLKEGVLKTVVWRKQPVFILRRTEEMIKKTEETDVALLKDPARPEERAIRPDIFVALGICTHLGCIPKFVMDVEGQPGFYCPCHAGKYDTLGRRLAGPPPENLHLLPYEFINDKEIVVGSRTFGGFADNIRKTGELKGQE